MLNAETIIQIGGLYVLGMICIGFPLLFYLDDLFIDESTPILAGLFFYPIVVVLLIIKIIIQALVELVKVIIAIFREEI